MSRFDTPPSVIQERLRCSYQRDKPRMTYLYPIPEELFWWREEPGGAAWLARLPSMISSYAERWELWVEAPFTPASVSFVAPVVCKDKTSAVLKINFPEEESEREPEALLHWSGEGAARLLRHDPQDRVLLIERCEPGERLWRAPEREAFPVAASLLRRLHRPPLKKNTFRSLINEAVRWANELPQDFEALGRPFEVSLIEEAVSLAKDLATSPGEPALLHQDLHGGNILRATREPWLVIDPKPLVGDREFDIASLLRDRRPRLMEDPNPVRTLQWRLDLLVDELSLDRERARGWALLHALAWGVTKATYYPEMIACARWISQLR